MIRILFGDCCKNCPHIDVDVENANYIFTAPVTTIGCAHMCVCEAYIREKDYKKMKSEEQDAHT